MRIHFSGDGNGLKFQFYVSWRSMTAFVKAALAAASTIAVLLASPVIARWLGW